MITKLQYSDYQVTQSVHDPNAADFQLAVSSPLTYHSDQSELEGINKKHNEEIQKYIGQI